MTKMFQQMRVGTLTDDAVRAKTGKKWNEWCKVLDKAGARMMDHAEIALWLEQQGPLPHWWAQMIAVGYENERGIRQSGPVQDPGYRCEVTVNKIIDAAPAAVWAAWQDPGTLTRWLPNAEFQITKTVPQKLLHLAWMGDTRVVVRFYERHRRTRLALVHSGLSESEAGQLQEYWCASVERLRVLMAR